VNRLLVPYLLDAIRALEEGVGAPCRHRRGHAPGLRAPDGAADAARLRRASTRRTTSRTSCSTSSARSASPAAAAEADGAGGPARAQDGKGFYDYAQEPPAAQWTGLV
jgi:hypothetical protein